MRPRVLRFLVQLLRRTSSVHNFSDPPVRLGASRLAQGARGGGFGSRVGDYIFSEEYIERFRDVH